MHELQENKTWRLDANSLNFEAARVADEQACLSSARPGLAARLRELFRRG